MKIPREPWATIIPAIPLVAVLVTIAVKAVL